MVEIKSIEIDGIDHAIKDETARTSIDTLMSDLQELIDRVSALETKAPLKIDEVTLLAENWQLDDDGSYSQVLDIPNATPNSLVEFKFTMAQLIVLHDKDVAFNTKNIGGVIVAQAMGTKPANDYTVQVTIQEAEFV